MTKDAKRNATVSDRHAGYVARMYMATRSLNQSEDWAVGWAAADRKLRGEPPAVTGPALTCPRGEDRRLTALNIAAKWADHGCDHRVELENATVRIERYLRTGSFDAEGPEAPSIPHRETR